MCPLLGANRFSCVAAFVVPVFAFQWGGSHCTLEAMLFDSPPPPPQDMFINGHSDFTPKEDCACLWLAFLDRWCPHVAPTWVVSLGEVPVGGALG